MDFVTAVKSCAYRYVEFKGRATRPEYWYFFLFCTIGSLALDIAGFDRLSLLFSLVILLPSLAAAVRRLHDTDRTGWWLLLVLIPILGGIVLIVFLARRGTEGPNRFGPEFVAPA
jgi:uncharacterized membrane protein YhaH (DUF805 family)